MIFKNIQSILITEKCKEKGIDCQLLMLGNEEFFVLTKKKREIVIRGAIINRVFEVSAAICENKMACNMMLQLNGVPVPDFIVINKMDYQAVIFLMDNDPIVVRPFGENKGKSIHMNINNLTQLERVVKGILEVSEYAILQKQAIGKDYRILVIDKKIAGVLYKEPAFIIGDGVNTIDFLVDDENYKRETDKKLIYGHSFKIQSVVPMTDIEEALNFQGLTMQDIPEMGEQIYISYYGDSRLGALAVDATGEIHPDNAKLALHIAELSGIDVLGIDLRCKAIQVSHKESEFAIVKLDARPDLVDHIYPFSGQSRDVLGDYLDYLFRNCLIRKRSLSSK